MRKYLEMGEGMDKDIKRMRNFEKGEDEAVR